jgi:hypothetical protein
MIDGSQSVTDGTAITIASTINKGIKKGTIALMTLCKGTPAISAVTYRLNPTGGVTSPIIKFTTTIIPN